MRFTKKFVKVSLVAGLVGSAFMPAGCNVSPELLTTLVQAVLSTAQSQSGGLGGQFNNYNNLAYGADGPAATNPDNDPDNTGDLNVQ